MDILSILVALATIIAGVFAAIQLAEWLRDWRQTRIRMKTRTYTSEIPATGSEPLKILNFSHPLEDQTLRQIEEEIKQPIGKIIEVNTHFDDNRSFKPPTKKLVEKIDFTPQEWQQGRFLVNLPGFAPIAAALLSELHGRMGHFPTILRLRTLKGSAAQTYELAEILNLQEIRDDARKTR
ncbi:MAG: hypothetical protein HUU32_16955 [Calditrichaceae bacterium]|nr:CRISPR-associated protein Csx15 [Calditrichia bacterium]NUQ43081.1 hypothetical protein [Calditrichaceae bacterium]